MSKRHIADKDIWIPGERKQARPIEKTVTEWNIHLAHDQYTPKHIIKECKYCTLNPITMKGNL